MKYISVNSLSDFEFHDAEFAFDSFVNNQLTVIAYYLNIHKNTEQNPFETDMEIERACITFEGIDIISYEPGREWQKDESGRFYSNEPQVIFSDDEAHCRFMEQLKTGITVFDLDIKERKIYFIDAMAADPFFTVCFTFERVVIAWDSYKKEAWYTSRNG